MNQDCTSPGKSLPVPENSISSACALLPPKDLKTMIRCVRALHCISQNPLYQRHVASLCPETARFDPDHDSVMMGYDFHLTDQGPRLIEINTNAGGGLLPWLREDLGSPPEKYKKLLLDTFFVEFSRFSGRNAVPGTLVILDQKPEKQFLYPEMLCFANLFREMKIKTCILDPSQLDASEHGVFHEKEPVDLIYYRHTDFYLETQEMAGVRAAYLARRVCLTPNPFAYALLADKQRLSLLSGRDKLEQFRVPRSEVEILLNTIPECHLMSDIDPDEIWSSRHNWVLKPLTKFGSRGVILGKKMSRKRFSEFPPGETLIQKFIPPSLTRIEDGTPLKTDFRLFVYQEKILGILARLFQGQVTNMQTPGGGFARVRIRNEAEPRSQA